MSKNPTLAKRRIRQHHGNYHQQKINLMHVCDKRLLPRKKTGMNEWMDLVKVKLCKRYGEEICVHSIWYSVVMWSYVASIYTYHECVQANRNMQLLTIHVLSFRQLEKKGKLWNISQQQFWLQIFSNIFRLGFT